MKKWVSLTETNQKFKSERVINHETILCETESIPFGYKDFMRGFTYSHDCKIDKSICQVKVIATGHYFLNITNK